MAIFFGWFFLSLIVASIGSSKEIGFWGSFFLSLLLSPLIGLIIVLVSKPKRQNINVAVNQTSVTSQQAVNHNTPMYSAVDEIKKLKDLLDSGALTQSEFDEQKRRILTKA